MLNVADIAIRQKNYQLFSNLLLQRPNVEMIKNWMDTFSEVPVFFTNDSMVDWEQWAYLIKKMVSNEEKMSKDYYELLKDPSSSRSLRHFSLKLAEMSYLTTRETHSSMKVRQQLQQEEIILLEKYLIPYLKQYRENHHRKLVGTIYFMYLDVIHQYLIWDYQKLYENKLV